MSHEFTRRYSTHRRNRSFKGCPHLLVITALKEKERFKKAGMENAELNLTSSLDAQLSFLLKQGKTDSLIKANNYPKEEKHLVHYFDLKSPKHF